MSKIRDETFPLETNRRDIDKPCGKIRRDNDISRRPCRRGTIGPVYKFALVPTNVSRTSVFHRFYVQIANTKIQFLTVSTFSCVCVCVCTNFTHAYASHACLRESTNNCENFSVFRNSTRARARVFGN